MDEHVATMGSEESQDLILQNVVPERHEGCGSCIHDEHAVSVADPFDKYVELLLVDRAASENPQVLSFKRPVLRKRRIDWICIQAVYWR